jgi:hypothetical protein
MCLVIVVNEKRFGEFVERYRHKYPRLASLINGPPPQTLPPQYEEGPKPITKRPDSLTLPAYAGYRKHTAGHTGKDVKDSEKAVV